jgi:hypothetical protein
MGPTFVTASTFHPQPNQPLYLPSKRPAQIRSAYAISGSKYLVICSADIGDWSVVPENAYTGAELGDSEYRRYEREYCHYDPALFATVSSWVPIVPGLLNA